MPEHTHMRMSDPHLEMTVATVDWNVVASIACRLLEVSDFHWGNLLLGGYNVVRFLHMKKKPHRPCRPRPVPTRGRLDLREFKNYCRSVVKRGRYDSIREAREGSYEHPCSTYHSL